LRDDVLDRLKARQKRCTGRAKLDLWRLMRDAIAEIERWRREADLQNAEK